jgi:hypothetical protein
MDAAKTPSPKLFGADAGSMGGVPRVVSAAEFRQLLVSHRKLVRVDRRADRMRGLRDEDTGELFFTDEHRLLDAPRAVLSFY